MLEIALHNSYHIEISLEVNLIVKEGPTYFPKMRSGPAIC